MLLWNFLFGFTAVVVLLVGRPWRQGLIEAGVYGVSGPLDGLFAILIGVYLRGGRSVGDLLRWFFWLFYSAGEPQPYTLGNPATAILKMVKGQSTSFIFGTQAASDGTGTTLLRSSFVLFVLGSASSRMGSWWSC